MPASYARELDPTDTTGRFNVLEEPADEARAKLRRATQRLADGIERNLQAHKRFSARLQALEDEWGGAPRIALLVEDSAETRRLMRFQLERIGFERIDEADDYESAEALLATQRVRYDLVICDVRLRGGDVGLDVVTLVRSSSARPLVPVLVVSGRDPDDTEASVAKKLTGEELERWADRSGATDCLQKPFSFEELQAMVRKLMRDAAPQTKLRK